MIPPAKRSALASLALLCLVASAGTVHAAGVFTLTSPEFEDGAILDRHHAGNDKANSSCTGDNVSVALQFANAPAATRSFALLIYDQQGRLGLGVSHQVAYGIPAASSGFRQGELEGTTGFVGGKGTAGKTSYYGPCPPPGSGLHHYVFTLIATDLAPTALEAGLTREQLLDRLGGHALASAGLVARFGQ